MLKDIAVHLPVDRPAGVLIECAVSIARLFDAHLDGIACVYQALNPMIAPEAAAVVLAAVVFNSSSISCGLIDGFTCQAKAATPATYGTVQLRPPVRS